MAYFKKKQMKANGKWYPVAVTIGRPVGTDVIAKKLADLSSLSTGDVKSVLDLLGGVLGDYMNQGRSVKLDGVGTFYGAQQIAGTRVRFIPEVSRGSSGQITTRSLVAADAFWELLDDEIPAHPVPDDEEEETPGGEDGGDGVTEDPLT